MSTTYLFGAGASRCVGLPTVKDSIEMMLREAEAEKKITPGGLFTLKNVKTVKSKYYSFKKSKNRSTYGQDIEGFLEWLKDKYMINKIANLQNIVFWYFWDRAHHVEASRYHKLFIKKILKPNDSIISFNYDLMLEKAFFDLNSNTETGRLQITNTYKDHNFTIIKPMGSVGFKKYKDINLDPSRGTWEFGYNEKEHLEPVMKWFELSEEHKEYRKHIIQNAKNAIRESREVISFGYAFPKSDEDELDEIFDGYSKVIKIVCGEDFNVMWSGKMKFENEKIKFEDWILKNSNNKR